MLKRFKQALRFCGGDFKAFAVVLADTVRFNGFTVLRGAVAFIAVPVVMGKRLVQLQHIIVAVGFGQYAGGCNGGIEGIAFYNTMVWRLFPGSKPVAVYQQQFGRHVEPIESKMHGLERCL